MRLRLARGSLPHTRARVAELADALRSGRSDRKVVEVRVLSRAPILEKPVALVRAKWKFPLALLQEKRYLPVEAVGEQMTERRIDLPQGTLDLLILRTLALEALHGWAISERIHQISSKVLFVQQGSLYPALHRLERKGWIKARWGASENNRRAKFYELTASGRKQLELEESTWRKLAAAVAQILETT
jgi:PadR family transcriptional regulator PadR